MVTMQVQEFICDRCVCDQDCKDRDDSAWELPDCAYDCDDCWDNHKEFNEACHNESHHIVRILPERTVSFCPAGHAYPVPPDVVMLRTGQTPLIPEVFAR